MMYEMILEITLENSMHTKFASVYSDKTDEEDAIIELKSKFNESVIEALKDFYADSGSYWIGWEFKRCFGDFDQIDIDPEELFRVDIENKTVELITN